MKKKLRRQYDCTVSGKVYLKATIEVFVLSGDGEVSSPSTTIPEGARLTCICNFELPDPEYPEVLWLLEHDYAILKTCELRDELAVPVHFHPRAFELSDTTIEDAFEWVDEPAPTERADPDNSPLTAIWEKDCEVFQFLKYVCSPESCELASKPAPAKDFIGGYCMGRGWACLSYGADGAPFVKRTKEGEAEYAELQRRADLPGGVDSTGPSTEEERLDAIAQECAEED